ncbi:hypothetical protein CVT26_013144 [Gymnopilus dilepis]|uniref:Uncharacterized protein n=1 Tax=Gymnopilus dilepis TaxID=231916 RepID=A0A409VWD2_9AGAR|nr:hypothetical protein CVT26_013144 [Gymnopilus dilepis]
MYHESNKGSALCSTNWRIRCADCPGKIYYPGPGETLANFDVHLKNREHRRRVSERVAASQAQAPAAAAEADATMQNLTSSFRRAFL